jgi:hypothetical protein
MNRKSAFAAVALVILALAGGSLASAQDLPTRTSSCFEKTLDPSESRLSQRTWI